MEKISKKTLLIIFLLAVSSLVVLVFSNFHYSKNYFHQPLIKKPIWENKVSLDNSDPLKIGLITDTHISSSGQFSGDLKNRFLKKEDKEVFNDFKESMDEFNPEFIFHLGDLIEGTKESQDLGTINLKFVREEMEKTGKPIYWVIGNHDLRAVSRRYFLESLDIDYLNKSLDYGPYRFIILDAAYQNSGVPINPLSGDYIFGFLPEENLLWLEKKLKTDQHVIVISHYSFISKSRIKKNPVKNSGDARKLFEKYNVKAVFNGHIEKRYYEEKNGVEYYSFPGAKKHLLYPGAFYEIILDSEGLHINMHYRNPQTNEKIIEPFYKEELMDVELEKEINYFKEELEEVPIEE